MTPSELTPLLTECYRDRLALLQQHVASAREVSDYDVNNAYQNVVARGETHVYWVHRAILDLGGTVPPAPAEPVQPKGPVAELASADARRTRMFTETWTPRVATIDHARHRKMLEVMLGELHEHCRLFSQAADGRVDIIGTPSPGTIRAGLVMDRRWVE